MNIKIRYESLLPRRNRLSFAPRPENQSVVRAERGVVKQCCIFLITGAMRRISNFPDSPRCVCDPRLGH